MPQAGITVGYSFVPSPIILGGELDLFGLNVRSLREPLTRAVRQVVIPSIQRNFDAGGRPPWEPLSDATDMIKYGKGFSGGPLVRTGNLKRNMGYVSMWTITSQDASIQALPDRVAYGAVHQAGTDSGGGRGHNIPQRMFATIQAEDEQKIEDVFDRWLAEKALEAGWH
jgi:phage gpG-like protein